MANPVTSLSALLRKINIEDDEEALNAADAVLETSPQNLDALHTRVVALIKLDRFEDALQALEESGEKVASRCLLEKAYALYKTGRHSEAELLAESKYSRGLKHVAAQVAYRSEKFAAAAQHYRDLSSQKSLVEGEDNDIKINTLATDAQLEWQSGDENMEYWRELPVSGELDTFEISYNLACRFIARSDYETSSVLLEKAKDLCEISEEMSDDEKLAELLPIMIQQAYVFVKLGELDKAKSLCKSINISDVPELSTRAIAQNNALAILGYENPYIAQKTFDSVLNQPKAEKYFSHQANIIQRNKYAINLQTFKYPGVARSTAQLIKTSSPTISPHLNALSVLHAAACSENGTGKPILKVIPNLLHKRPNDVGLVLLSVQLYIQSNNIGKATSTLEIFFKNLEESIDPADQDVRHAPGLVALIVTLYQLSGRKRSIKLELSKAASHWRRKNRPPLGLLRAAGASLLQSHDPNDLTMAHEIFCFLRAQDPSDTFAIAGFVASSLTKNISLESSDLEKLTSVSELISEVDVAALEKAGVPSLPTTSVQVNKKRNIEEVNLPAKKRKLSKKRTPKDFIEGKKMDPERWLPMRDRSYYRPKGKKGKKKASEFTQGGVVKDQDALDPAIVTKSEKPNANKMKKKKGRK
ncbi:Bgt-510 [Blumeria graminis f. sp. tritici]|uniref:Signal recognition particle subunit SRP72 n=2 Tax=Blumeria graminis f. sp. tritici TaxID=62690 RepID=E7DZJ1_BLUGR|nr:hypothetical protein [Blumeria graminis f. sp. tritici]EPQ63049.1 Core component of the signal recognition particle ribonucleoprotein complex [Blumeria graminis f. sp. tritici 96224]VDB96419.1 Bgt-510 [Blumeria graminis f. sp. tritici]